MSKKHFSYRKNRRLWIHFWVCFTATLSGHCSSVQIDNIRMLYNASALEEASRQAADSPIRRFDTTPSHQSQARIRQVKEREEESERGCEGIDSGGETCLSFCHHTQDPAS